METKYKYLDGVIRGFGQGGGTFYKKAQVEIKKMREEARKVGKLLKEN